MVIVSLGCFCSGTNFPSSPGLNPLEVELLLRYTLSREGIHILFAATFFLLGTLPLPAQSQLGGLFLSLAESVEVRLFLANHA